MYVCPWFSSSGYVMYLIYSTSEALTQYILFFKIRKNILRSEIQQHYPTIIEAQPEFFETKLCFLRNSVLTLADCEWCAAACRAPLKTVHFYNWELGTLSASASITCGLFVSLSCPIFFDVPYFHHTSKETLVSIHTNEHAKFEIDTLFIYWIVLY